MVVTQGMGEICIPVLGRLSAGGGFITALPGAAAFDSAFSFGLIRGGHLAMTVLGALGQIAKEEGTTVVLTVHQPSSSMWSAFDRLMLMAPGGKVCYLGGREDATAHFDSLGMPLPPALRRALWFVALWAAGVLAVGAVALLLRSLLLPA